MTHIGALALIKEFLDWRTIIDVALITAGLFILYRTLKRLGTWKIMAGMLVAMLISLMANVLNLNGIKWIYSNLSHVVLIALIVIFQPELRKMFERAVSIRRSEVSDPGNILSQTIVDGLFTLAQEYRGAIVVLPGKEQIQEFLSGGYMLKARPSFPLFVSIFDPNSPGHDGALVISKGLFSQFGVRLPLSHTAKLPAEYGTRHHAAMGLAETTDAFVCVVSEERGQVSVFHKGEMWKPGSREELQAAILSHWKETSSYLFEFKDGHSRLSVFRQLAVSFALAFFFWSTIIVAQGEWVERPVTVPVEYSASGPDLALVGEREKEVQLVLGGTKSHMDEVDSAALGLKIDLSQFKPGTQTYFITSDNVRLPKGVKLLEVIPSKLELTLASITEQWAAVVPQLVGSLPPGFKKSSVDVIPQKVRVLAPTPEKGKKALSVTTTPIYMESINENTRVFCKIIAPQTIQPVGRPWPEVEVNISVKKKG
ncbi:MAG: diadenylate cyclase [Desulfosalsimonadaceae bacterium]